VLSKGASILLTSFHLVKHSREELQRFRDDPTAYMAWRAKIEKLVNAAADITVLDTSAQKEFFTINREAMAKKLAKKPEVMDALEPSWPPGCRRLTPGPGYLEALVEDNVNFISTKIKRITTSGIETVDGKQRDVDLIICATGFDTSLKQPMPLIGRDGASLNDIWRDHPESYLGIFPPEMPNMMRFIGPNGACGTGGLLLVIERACEYMIQVVQKAQREYIKTVVPKAEAIRMFVQHTDHYFEKTIYTQPCKSWMKRGNERGRIVTIWPGSAIHILEAYKHPRWEDFDYTYCPETSDNHLRWLGNGLTALQEHGNHTAEYLETVDHPPVVNNITDYDTVPEPSIAVEI